MTHAWMQNLLYLALLLGLAFPLGAFMAKVLEGERTFRAVAVVTGAEAPTAPCGACRQVLVEFAQGGDMEVVLATLNGARHATTLGAIFPLSFREFSPTSE